MILQHLVALKIAFEKADIDKSGGLDMEEVIICKKEGKRMNDHIY